MECTSKIYAPWVEKHGLNYPYGKCQCGCGLDAPIAKYKDHRRGTLQGAPQRYINGHGANVQKPRYKYQTLSEAFLSQVAQAPAGKCWDAHKTVANGYGRVNYKGKQYYAHRVAYRLYRGAIPNGMFVCHRCDRPSCANPSHLFLGSVRDNVADMIAKRRHAKGVRHGQYKHGKYAMPTKELGTKKGGE